MTQSIVIQGDVRDRVVMDAVDKYAIRGKRKSSARSWIPGVCFDDNL